MLGLKTERKNKIALALISIVSLEVSFIIGLLVFNTITNKRSLVISPIKKEEVLFATTENLEYFYELNPDQTEEDLYIPDWLDYKPKITINQDGLNERFNYSLQKQPETYRIIVLGDSWTYGRYVSTADNYSEVLEDLLNSQECSNYNKFEVINLGVPSYDIEYSIERFRLRGQKYSPDLILWLLIENDFSEINEFLRERKQEYLKNEDANNESPGRTILDALTSPPYSPQVQAWLNALEDLKKEYPKDKLLGYQNNALNSIKSYHDGKIVFVTLPGGSKIDPDAVEIIENFVSSDEDSKHFESKIDFERGGLLLPDRHPNKEGHNEIANDIYQYLINEKMIKCDN